MTHIIRLFKDGKDFCISLDGTFWAQGSCKELLDKSLDRLVGQLDEQGRKYRIIGSYR